MNDDEDDPHHTACFNQASRFGPSRRCQVLSEFTLVVVRRRVASPNGRRLSSSEAGNRSPSPPSWIQTKLETRDGPNLLA